MHRGCLAVSAKPLVSPTGEAAVDHKVYACAETCCLAQQEHGRPDQFVHCGYPA